MYYSKPIDVTYVQMAHWIDHNVYTENVDWEQLYKYVYYLAHMLAYKNGYFPKQPDKLDDFSLYVAVYMFRRYYNSSDPDIEIDLTQKNKKIKSVLNYLRNSLFGLKAHFMAWDSIITDTQSSTREITDYRFADELLNTANEYALVDFQSYLCDISGTIYSIVKTTPFREGTSEFFEVYTSCLLSLLDSLTIPNDYQEKIDNQRTVGAVNNLIGVSFGRLQYSQALVFHLDNSIKDYITILVKRGKFVVKQDLQNLLTNDTDPKLVAMDICRYILDIGDDDD